LVREKKIEVKSDVSAGGRKRLALAGSWAKISGKVIGTRIPQKGGGVTSGEALEGNWFARGTYPAP